MKITNNELKIHKVENQGELSLFIELFYEETGTRFSVKYLKQGEVFFIFYKSEIVGGYAIITELPFRFLSLLNDDVRKSNSFLNTFSYEKLCEVNGFFVKRKKFLKIILKNLLYYLTTKVCRPYVLLFYNIDNKKVHNLWQKNLKPVEIYRGKKNTGETQASLNNFYFGYVNKFNLNNFLQKII